MELADDNHLNGMYIVSLLKHKTTKLTGQNEITETSETTKTKPLKQAKWNDQNETK